MRSEDPIGVGARECCTPSLGGQWVNTLSTFRHSAFNYLDLCEAVASGGSAGIVGRQRRAAVPPSALSIWGICGASQAAGCQLRLRRGGCEGAGTVGGSLLLLFLLAATSWSVSGSVRAAPPPVAVGLPFMGAVAAVSPPVAAAVAVPAAVPAVVPVALPAAAELEGPSLCRLQLQC